MAVSVTSMSNLRGCVWLAAWGSKSEAVSLAPKSRIKHISTGLILRQPSSTTAIPMMYLQATDRGPGEFLMKALFEILNKLKLIHDFLMGPVEASRIADCFSHDEQTSTAGEKGRGP